MAGGSRSRGCAVPVELRGHARAVAFAQRVEVAAVLVCVSEAS